MKLDFNQAMAESIGLLDKAKDVLQHRLESDPGDWEIVWKLGETWRQLGHAEQALDCYFEVLRLNPGAIEAENLISILSGKGPLPNLNLEVTPVPYVVIDQVLSDAELKIFWSCAIKNKNNFSQSVIADGLVPDVRSSFVLYEDCLGEVQPFVHRRVADELKKQSGQFGLNPLDVCREEMQVTRHSDGEFYNTHRDVGIQGGGLETRTLTYVIYLFSQPARFSGGDLLLYDSIDGENGYISKFTRIIPQHNSMLLFPSTAWHQVTPVKSQSDAFEFGRFTINGWLHTDKK